MDITKQQISKGYNVAMVFDSNKNEVILCRDRFAEKPLYFSQSKEGLYFASEWSENYDTLISLSDQGEKKLEGSILYANVGKGSHVHCALNLFYQMDNCVIGAFRIFENLLYSKK